METPERYIEILKPSGYIGIKKKPLEGGDARLLAASPPPMAHPVAHHVEEELELSSIYRNIYKNTCQMDCQSIMVTFKPSLVLSNTLKTALVKKVLKETLKKTTKDTYIGLFYELSPTGVFHMHGIISKASKETLQRIKYNLELYVGITRIKQITYFDSYVAYLTKRYHKERTSYDLMEGYKYDIVLTKNKK